MSKVQIAHIDLKTSDRCRNNKVSNSDSNQTAFLCDIVSASTLAPPGNEIDTSLRCRKRPEHKQCNGLIRVQLQEDPVELRWWCPVCGDSGTLNNWKGIPWKKNHIRSTDDDKNKEYCEIILSTKDFDLLKQIAIIDPVAKCVVENAVFVNNGMLLMGTVNSIDALIGYIAFEVNHESRPRRQEMLSRLFDKICSILKGQW